MFRRFLRFVPQLLVFTLIVTVLTLALDRLSQHISLLPFGVGLAVITVLAVGRIARVTIEQTNILRTVADYLENQNRINEANEQGVGRLGELLAELADVQHRTVELLRTKFGVSVPDKKKPN